MPALFEKRMVKLEPEQVDGIMTAEFHAEFQKPMVELEPEQVDRILIAELKQQLEWFDRDHQCRSGGVGIPIFDDDPTEDIKKIEQHMNAIRTVLSWYGVEDAA